MSLGLGVMISMLGGNENSVKAFQSTINKTITELSLGADDALHFTFEDGSKLKLFDDGQICCESRYMRTDDNLSAFVGSKLLDAEVRGAPDEPNEYGDVHEVAFLIITTDKGAFTMATHNEHNGYYGGFSIRAAAE